MSQKSSNSQDISANTTPPSENTGAVPAFLSQTRNSEEAIQTALHELEENTDSQSHNSALTHRKDPQALENVSHQSTPVFHDTPSASVHREISIPDPAQEPLSTMAPLSSPVSTPARPVGATSPNSSAALDVLPASTQGLDSALSTQDSTYASPGVSATTARVTEQTGKHASQTRVEETPSYSRYIFAVLLIAAVLLGGFFFLSRSCSRAQTQDPVPVSANSDMTTITFPEGSGASVFADKLVEAGIISDASAFLQTVSRQGAEQSLKPGTYMFTPGTDISEIVRQLVAGPNTSDSSLTVPEGLTIAQLASLVEDKFGINAQSFIDQASAANYSFDYPFVAAAEDNSLEGFLFPKTYDFSGKEISADLIIRAMLAQYQIEMANYDFTEAEAAIKERYGVTMTDYDILKLASIIEREAFSAEDYPLVASVFYNRMQAGMALQSDATMTYVTGGSVNAADLTIDSPYNTYLYTGLTPTPICSPSLISLEAAMNPPDTDYYYFLLIENGDYSNHTFSETYEQHQAAIDLAMQEQAS